MPSSTAKRPIRIAGASGGFTDRQRAIHDLAKNCNVDVIVGDWMSECTMTIHGALKVAREGKEDQGPGLFDPCFMGSLTPGLPVLQANGVKLAVNAGASDAELLAREVKSKITELGLSLKVAWIEGDEVTPQVKDLIAKGEKFTNLDTGKDLSEWGYEPIYAQCYLGGLGIAEAFRAGADIVVCGRVADAAPTIGAAAWWHGWDRSDLDALAGSLMAGHLIECSAYVTGGYYSAFKDLFDGCENLGFPIAAVEANGETVLTKEANTGGEVSVGTVTSQLVYEIQGPLYYNSDVTANIEGIKFTQTGKDEVRMTGVKGLPPPPTTKVGLTAQGGFQAEFHYLFVGLDIEKKAEWTERQIRYAMGKNIDKLTCLKFQLIGSVPENPDNQNSATADFRVFVQTRDPSVLGLGNMTGPNFTRWCMENFLQSAPGATIVPDQRQAAPKNIYEYWVALLPQDVVKHRAVLEWNNQAIDIPAPKITQVYGHRQNSYETEAPVDLATFGPTTRGPIGWVVLGRSGDKASNANIGLFVRHDDEWDWVRSLLTKDKFIELLAKEYLGHGLDRFEMPNLKTVHFLLKDHLDRGFNSTSSLDGLGKNLCEFIRCRHVDIPNKFLARGKV
ncbi:hypothetical protein SPBR_01500 [Sporothrix brasiliensis 5110]|uniref:DUF1446 domain protein n=1 Tax=Sporothrix brasiliensis 5110 TaxID=1398154 RepID=A0A0C2J4A4_9PEZI|nr:uncharacterized protein SPBR_01500 [Sporothrix brasiliensis 5110]KIH91927.1 hypothetical protein SPBR_01500 [Sporothrix brasiliensis 5110]